MISGVNLFYSRGSGTILIDPDGSGLEFVGHAECRVDRTGVETGGETVLGVVGFLNNFLDRAERGDAKHRAEDFVMKLE